MFKNIELTEINSDNVLSSLWLLLLVAFIFGLLTMGFTAGSDESGFSLTLISYFFIQLVFMGSPIWGLTLFIFYLIERFTLGKRSTTKTVRILFLTEMILPVVILLGSFFVGKFDPEALILACGIILAQWIRWIYLKRENRMYNYVK